MRESKVSKKAIQRNLYGFEAMIAATRNAPVVPRVVSSTTGMSAPATSVTVQMYTGTREEQLKRLQDRAIAKERHSVNTSLNPSNG